MEMPSMNLGLEGPHEIRVAAGFQPQQSLRPDSTESNVSKSQYSAHQDFRKESNLTEQANVQTRFPVRTTRRTATLAQQGHSAAVSVKQQSMSLDTMGTGEDDLFFDSDLDEEDDQVGAPKKRTRRRVQVDTVDPKTGLPLSAVEIRRAKRRITNRESARRMRVKRMAEWDNLKAQVRNNKERLREMEKQLQMSENNLRLACQHNAFFLEKIDALTDLLNKNNIAVPGDKDIMAAKHVRRQPPVPMPTVPNFVQVNPSLPQVPLTPPQNWMPQAQGHAGSCPPQLHLHMDTRRAASTPIPYRVPLSPSTMLGEFPDTTLMGFEDILTEPVLAAGEDFDVFGILAEPSGSLGATATPFGNMQDPLPFDFALGSDGVTLDGRSLSGGISSVHAEL